MKYFYYYKSPNNFSNIYLLGDGEFLRGLYFENSNNLKAINLRSYRMNKEVFETSISWLNIYFNGENPHFLPKYSLGEISDFRQLVYGDLLKLSFGEVAFYSYIGEKIAVKKNINSMSSRAVGTAIGKNPISIIIPCHRIIRKDLNIGNYDGGFENKKNLLELEGNTIKDFKIVK